MMNNGMAVTGVYWSRSIADREPKAQVVKKSTWHDVKIVTGPGLRPVTYIVPLGEVEAFADWCASMGKAAIEAARAFRDEKRGWTDMKDAE